MNRDLSIQLWSYNYAPEPTGIGPVSTVLAEGLHGCGHDVHVVSAHPHYPRPVWGTRYIPYREIHRGIPVLRLPLWVGRANTSARLRQEVTYTVSLFAALPFITRPDIVVATSPSFPALLPALVYSRLNRVPLVLWLQDILPEGAIATGHVKEGVILRASRWLERSAYHRASRIVVVSAPFLDNLLSKGVPQYKLVLIYNPVTRPVPEDISRLDSGADKARIICMGNIGHTQGLPPLIRAFDRSEQVRRAGVRLVITGSGVAEEETRRQITSDTVEMLGVVSEERLDQELRLATLAMVSQRYEGTEFNLPSKIMNYMAYGLPIVAAVNPASEAARLIKESGSGWVADSSRPDEFPVTVLEALHNFPELRKRGQAGRKFALAHFTREGLVERFASLLKAAVENSVHR